MVDVKEASSIVGRTPETVRRWIWSGRLSAQRDGRRLLVSRDDLLRLVGVDGGGQSTLTLHEWAEQARGLVRGTGGTTASDLVSASRQDRQVGAGSAPRTGDQ